MRNNIPTYPLQSMPLGKSWEEWVKMWWKWCYGNCITTSPVSDRTGSLCGKGQVYYDVWFLAGTFGGKAERTCIIPNHRSLFFPILNDIVSFATDPLLKTEEQLSLYAKADLDNTKFLHVLIDGVEPDDIWQYRIRTSAFDLALPVSTENEKYMTTRAVSDGYWMFLEPLSIGYHSIYFAGEKLEFDKTGIAYGERTELPTFAVEVKYYLTVCE